MLIFSGKLLRQMESKGFQDGMSIKTLFGTVWSGTKEFFCLELLSFGGPDSYRWDHLGLKADPGSPSLVSLLSFQLKSTIEENLEREPFSTVHKRCTLFCAKCIIEHLYTQHIQTLNSFKKRSQSWAVSQCYVRNWFVEEPTLQNRWLPRNPGTHAH